MKPTHGTGYSPLQFRLLKVALLISLIGNGGAGFWLWTRHRFVNEQSAELGVSQIQKNSTHKKGDVSADEIVSADRMSINSYEAGRLREIARAFNSRIRAIKSDPNRAYWKFKDLAFPDIKESLERLDARKEREKALLALFGDDYQPDVPSDYQFLPKEKQIVAYYLEEEKRAFERSIRGYNLGIILPHEQAVLDELQSKNTRELEAALSPEELFQLKLRTSSEASVLSMRLQAANISEEEYIAIYNAANNAQLLQTPKFGDAVAFKSNKDDFKRVVLDAIPEERRSNVARALDTDFQQLSDLATRLNLQQDAIVPLYQMKADFNRLMSDSSLTPAAKTEALQTLSRNIDRVAVTTIGADGYEAFKKMSPWMHTLALANSTSTRLSSPK